MLLCGNIDFKNDVYNAEGLNGNVEIPFTLPARLHKRKRLILKYLAFHSGLSWDVVDMQTGIFEVQDTDTSKKMLYQYRGSVKSLDLRVFADGVNIMHTNTSSHFIDDENGMVIDDTRNKECLSFYADKISDAMLHNGADPLDYDVESSLSAFRGHSQLYEITLGEINPNVSEIKVVFNGKHLAMSNSSEFSFEKNIRMDRISIVLELK